VGGEILAQQQDAARRGEGRHAELARLPHTVPRAFSFEETFDVGEDTASPVGPYAAPFPFAGTLGRLELRSRPPPGDAE
jgi:hypothetical protein